jgi:hypothetical protein
MAQNEAPVTHPKINISIRVYIDKIFSLGRLCDKRVRLKKSNVVAYAVYVESF